jgi:ubiquinone biosynthesis protein COQ9
LQDKAVGGALYKYLRHQHKKYRKRCGVSSLLIASFAFCAVLLAMGSARYSALYKYLRHQHKKHKKSIDTLLLNLINSKKKCIEIGLKIKIIYAFH